MEAGFWLDVVIVFAEVLLVGEAHAGLLIENNNRTCQNYHRAILTHQSSHAIESQSNTIIDADHASLMLASIFSKYPLSS